MEDDHAIVLGKIDARVLIRSGHGVGQDPHQSHIHCVGVEIKEPGFSVEMVVATVIGHLMGKLVIGGRLVRLDRPVDDAVAERVGFVKIAEELHFVVEIELGVGWIIVQSVVGTAHGDQVHFAVAGSERIRVLDEFDFQDQDLLMLPTAFRLGSGKTVEEIKILKLLDRKGFYPVRGNECYM